MRWTQRANVYPPRILGAKKAGQWMDDLVAYVEQYEPAFHERLEGASGEEVAELERLVGRPLPGNYRLFLERMGRDQGGLMDGYAATLSVDETLDHYRVCTERYPQDLPRDCVVIARGRTEDNDELSLRLNPNKPQAEPQVVWTCHAEIAETVAKSLPRLLFQQAFLRYEMGHFPFGAEYHLRVGDHTLDRVALVAEQIGFAKKWFRDPMHWCGWAADAALMAEQLDGRDGWIRLAGSSASIARHGSQLVKYLGVDFVQHVSPGAAAG